MGQKVHPIGFRTGVTRDWESRWYADKQHFGQYICEDFNIRKYVNKNLAAANIAKTEIERDQNEIEVIIHAARPGLVIGRRGSEVDKIRGDLRKIAGGRNIQIKIREVQQPELNSQLVAAGIAEQIVKRVNYRRAIKKAVETCVNAGAFGVKVRVAGRLAGAEIARADGYTVGNLPLQKLRAIIDYGFAEAATTVGNIGIKVWIYKGDVDTVAKESK
ncbi:30S ribosomal protein S3 [Planctomycetales bacterium]|nr:30S ribosomal protein S3 [Planctomycetales bacterium]GHS99742.1 30S ribosomal protein S3 [Planctomycetales bacterium]GHT07265.1 30S ribosomal protein S3 [Planctomycetales bacterium]GHV18510.1 30S ribosomal protein S3 [Planctomycetales bacterium]